MRRQASKGHLVAHVLALMRSSIPNSTGYCDLISQIISRDKIVPFSCLLHAFLKDSLQPSPLPTAQEVQTTYFSAFPHIVYHANYEVPKVMTMCHCVISFLHCDACKEF